MLTRRTRKRDFLKKLSSELQMRRATEGWTVDNRKC